MSSSTGEAWCCTLNIDGLCHKVGGRKRGTVVELVLYSARDLGSILTTGACLYKVSTFSL